MAKKAPQIVRIGSLADTLETIQLALEQIGGEKKKGAEMAINAVRKKYGIPADGEQLELFEAKNVKK